jgi:hypothetical protein
MRIGRCKPLRRVVPAVAKRNTGDAGKRHIAQLLCGLVTLSGSLACVGLVVNVLNTICEGVRGCMYEKSAPFPGPCQAFAEKASGPRIVDGR